MVNKFRRFGISAAVLAAAGLLLAAPQKADARVRIGVSVGAPVYAAPVAPYGVAPYDYGYAAGNPYAYDYGYSAPAYTYPAPEYVAPAAPYFSFGWGGHDGREWREHERHEQHEYYEHHDRGDYRGWRR